jgi:hypothetical protein
VVIVVVVSSLAYFRSTRHVLSQLELGENFTLELVISNKLTVQVGPLTDCTKKKNHTFLSSSTP